MAFNDDPFGTRERTRPRVTGASGGVSVNTLPTANMGLPGGTAGPPPTRTPYGPDSGNIPPVIGAPAPAPKPVNFGTSVGQYAPGHGSGYDPFKVNDPTKGNSAKYLLARGLSHFDPSQGITSDVLSALNTLGIGTFSGHGDRLTVGGNVSRDFGGTRNFDVIGGFNNPNHPKSWNYLQLDKPGGADHALDLLGFPAPSSAPQQTGDMSWLNDLLSSFTTPKPTAPTTPAPSTSTFIVPPMQPPSSAAPAPTVNGATTGYSSGQQNQAQAMHMLSMALPLLMNNPQTAQDPLTQQILRMVGGR